MNALSTNQSAELARHEKTVERGLSTFIDVGLALLRIRDDRLYRATHRTFGMYCEERWGMSRFYAHRLIGAAEVTENLLPIGNAPTTESQARPLTRLGADEQREAWAEAVETAPNGNITAKHVEAIVERRVGVRQQDHIRPPRTLLAGPTEDQEVRLLVKRSDRQICVVFGPTDDKPLAETFDFQVEDATFDKLLTIADEREVANFLFDPENSGSVNIVERGFWGDLADESAMSQINPAGCETGWTRAGSADWLHDLLGQTRAESEAVV